VWLFKQVHNKSEQWLIHKRNKETPYHPSVDFAVSSDGNYTQYLTLSNATVEFAGSYICVILQEDLALNEVELVVLGNFWFSCLDN
jgi:hypothetical protein